MIETLSLRNFKVLRSVDVRLRPLTLIVGPNGSGKSSILLALERGFSALCTLPLSLLGHSSDHYLSGAKSLLAEGPLELRLSVRRGERSWSLGLVEGRDVALDGDNARAFREEEYRLARLDLNLESLATPSPEANTLQALSSDGSGLAWVLAGLHLEAYDKFTEIVERLREVVPSVLNIRIKRRFRPEGVWYELLFDMKGGEGIPVGQVSEGTLMALAILVLLAGPNPPGLVLVESLERGLHPGALKDFVGQIRLIQKQNPRLQIVATSHSPYLLDFVEAEEILLTSLGEDGYASAGVLSDHPDYGHWKGVMDPGEFWSSVGESWVVQKT